jgi:membrane protein
LSTPVVRLWEGVLALPLIGTLDCARTQIVLEEIVTSGAEIVIIDITGVPTGRHIGGAAPDQDRGGRPPVTFYSLLALFPGIAVLVSIYGLFADPSTIVSHLDTIAGFAPGGAIDVLREQLTRLAAQGSTRLGIGFLVGLMISLWSANSGMKALFDALNAVYQKKEKRSFTKLNAVTLSSTIWNYRLSADCGRLRRCSSSCPQLLPGCGRDRPAARPRSVADPFGACRFRARFDLPVGPRRIQRRWQSITRGSAFAAILWLVASALFSWYAANFGNFNKTYGSLGAIVGFMTWMWLSIIVVLVGAKLNAEVEHRTMREAKMAGTTGPSYP